MYRQQWDAINRKPNRFEHNISYLIVALDKTEPCNFLYFFINWGKVCFHGGIYEENGFYFVLGFNCPERNRRTGWRSRAMQPSL